jgi:hypothetical protein
MAATGKTGAKTAEMRLLVTLTDDNSLGSQILRFTAEPTAFASDGCLYGPGSCLVDLPRDLEDFTIEAVRDAGFPGSSLFPAQAAYRRVYRVDLTRAEAIVTVLRKVQRKVTQLAGRYGDPADLAQYTAYVAEAIGVTAERPFLRRVEPGQDYDGTGHQAMSPSELRRWLHSQERAWEQKHHLPAGQP